MKDSTGEGWKVLADGDEAENVPLWKALAQFTSEDLDEGLRSNAAIINRNSKKPLRNQAISFALSMMLGGLCFLSFLTLVSLPDSKSASALVLIVLLLFFAALTPYFLRWRYQYGSLYPDAPLDLPHEADKHFDAFLQYLQREGGPKAYYLTRFGRKRVALKRRQFYGRLRYFLFSEQDADRSMVIRYPTALSVPTDLYLHRDDVHKIIAQSSRPKRKGGPGRKAKYRYDDALIALIGNPRLLALGLSEQATAIRAIKKCLAKWFEDNDDDGSGDIPRDDLLAPYAKKIYDHLKNIATTPVH